MAGASTGEAAMHLPRFIAVEGQPDILFNAVVVIVLVLVLILGNFYLRLHALPERMAHRANSGQFQLVAVLAILALFTHNNFFWMAALLLAAIQLPDFVTPVNSMARSLEKLAAAGEQANVDVAPESPEVPPEGDAPETGGREHA